MNVYRFHHADRARTLVAGQKIEADSEGWSAFGRAYWPAYRETNRENISIAEQRECLAKHVRQEPSFAAKRPSRFQVLFATLSVEDAIWHAENVEPRPEIDIPIYEILASEFVTLDRNWLDYDGLLNGRLDYARSYWWGEISNHRPIVGERRPPRLEVLVSLPAHIGELVGSARFKRNAF